MLDINFSKVSVFKKKEIFTGENEKLLVYKIYFERKQVQSLKMKRKTELLVSMIVAQIYH